METKINILRSFFENPNGKFSIRQLARILGLNHTTVRQYLNKLVDEEFLSFKKEGIYVFYNLVLSRKTLNLKLYYNLEKIRKSNLIEDLEKSYDLPVIILFGSYAYALDDATSDVDICLISNVKKSFSFEKYEKILNRKISSHNFNRLSWEKAKKLNKSLINSICNGLVLSGQLEVL